MKTRNPHPKEIERVMPIIKKALNEFVAYIIKMKKPGLVDGIDHVIKTTYFLRFFPLEPEDITKSLAIIDKQMQRDLSNLSEDRERQSYQDSITMSWKVLKDLHATSHDGNAYIEYMTIKNKNLYSFAVDYKINFLTLFLPYYRCFGEYYEWPPVKPVLRMVFAGRKFDQTRNTPRNVLNDYFYSTTFYDEPLIRHVDDRLQSNDVFQYIKNLKLLPSPNMTKQNFVDLKIKIEEFDSRGNLEAIGTKKLKEVPWMEMNKPPFVDDPLNNKTIPPHLGVIQKGETIVDLGKMKWVFLNRISIIVPDQMDSLLKPSDSEPLYAPYEGFYMRHCGRDTGYGFLSLRVKVGNGWFPIAMATLNKMPDSSQYFVSSLKSFSNCRYWYFDKSRSLDEIIEARPCTSGSIGLKDVQKWLFNRGVKPEEFVDAVKQLLLDPVINLHRTNRLSTPDKDLYIIKEFWDDKKFTEKHAADEKYYANKDE